MDISEKLMIMNGNTIQGDILASKTLRSPLGNLQLFMIHTFC